MINYGIGPTRELSLRVSVATLVRVLFKNPRNNELMLALERKASVNKTGNEGLVQVNSQPFGGAIRIIDLKAIHDLIGDFHFDSKRSRSEQDFRLFVRPESWEVLRKFCIECFSRETDLILETTPERELAEEFDDTLKINLKSDQYTSKPIGIVIEDNPTPTENIYATGFPTARVYRTFEATISDSSLVNTMMINNKNFSNQDLCDLALEDAQKEGKGRANAIMTLPLKWLIEFYLEMSSNERDNPVLLGQNRLDETVPAVLEGVAIPKYKKLW